MARMSWRRIAAFLVFTQLAATHGRRRADVAHAPYVNGSLERSILANGGPRGDLEISASDARPACMPTAHLESSVLRKVNSQKSIAIQLDWQVLLRSSYRSVYWSHSGSSITESRA